MQRGQACSLTTHWLQNQGLISALQQPRSWLRTLWSIVVLEHNWNVEILGNPIFSRGHTYLNGTGERTRCNTGPAVLR